MRLRAAERFGVDPRLALDEDHWPTDFVIRRLTPYERLRAAEADRRDEIQGEIQLAAAGAKPPIGRL